MTPMMPKISVSPDASRNSSRPYWTALRHWTRKVARSMKRRRAYQRRRRQPRSAPAGVPGRRLRARLESELVEDVGDVALHRVRAQVERARDQLVAVAGGHAGQ